MKFIAAILLPFAAFSLTACANDNLNTVRPYPTDNDVCQILNQSAVTKPYEEAGTVLIGCPSHEMGAIEDRQREGARILGEVEARESHFGLIPWTILKLPK